MPKKCIEPDCKKDASYNVPGNNSRLYCSAHKKAGMIPAGRLLCISPDCGTYAVYAMPGETIKKYCKKHASVDMKNINAIYCTEPGCGTRANFGIIRNKPTHCSTHKTKQMHDVTHPICKECSTEAHYNFPGEKRRLYCAMHKLQNMIPV